MGRCALRLLHATAGPEQPLRAVQERPSARRLCQDGPSGAAQHAADQRPPHQTTVYSVPGASKILCVGPSSTTAPARITKT
jgi:hypothetical protein